MSEHSKQLLKTIQSLPEEQRKLLAPHFKAKVNRVHVMTFWIALVMMILQVLNTSIWLKWRSLTNYHFQVLDQQVDELQQLVCVLSPEDCQKKQGKEP